MQSPSPSQITRPDLQNLNLLSTKVLKGETSVRFNDRDYTITRKTGTAKVHRDWSSYNWFTKGCSKVWDSIARKFGDGLWLISRAEYIEKKLNDPVVKALSFEMPDNSLTVENPVVQKAYAQALTNIKNGISPKIDDLKHELRTPNTSRATDEDKKLQDINKRIDKIGAILQSLEKEFKSIEQKLHQQYDAHAAGFDVVKGNDSLTFALEERLVHISKENIKLSMEKLENFITGEKANSLPKQATESVSIKSHSDFFPVDMIGEMNDLFTCLAPANESDTNAAKRQAAHLERLKPLLNLVANEADVTEIKKEIKVQQEIKERIANQVKVGATYSVEFPEIFTFDEKNLEPFFSQLINEVNQYIAQCNDPEKVLTTDELGGIKASAGNVQHTIRQDLKPIVKARIELGEKIGAWLAVFQGMKLSPEANQVLLKLNVLKMQCEDTTQSSEFFQLNSISELVNIHLDQLWTSEKNRVEENRKRVAEQLDENNIRDSKVGDDFAGISINTQIQPSADAMRQIIETDKKIDFYEKRISSYLKITTFVEKHDTLFSTNSVIEELNKLATQLLDKSISAKEYDDIVEKTKFFEMCIISYSAIDSFVKEHNVSVVNRALEGIRGFANQLLDKGALKKKSDSVVEELKELASQLLDKTLSEKGYSEIIEKAQYRIDAKKTGVLIAEKIRETKEKYGEVVNDQCFEKLELFQKICENPGEVTASEWKEMLLPQGQINFAEILVIADGYVDFIKEIGSKRATTEVAQVPTTFEEAESNALNAMRKAKRKVSDIFPELEKLVNKIGEFIQGFSQFVYVEFGTPTRKSLEIKQKELINGITKNYNEALNFRIDKIRARNEALLSRIKNLHTMHPVLAQKELQSIEQAFTKLTRKINLLSSMNAENQKQLNKLINLIYFLEDADLINPFNFRLTEVAREMTAFIRKEPNDQNIHEYFALVAVEGVMNKLDAIADLIGQKKFSTLLDPLKLENASVEMATRYQQSIEFLFDKIKNKTSNAEEIQNAIDDLVDIKQSIEVSGKMIKATQKLATTYGQDNLGSKRCRAVEDFLSEDNVHEHHLALKTMMTVYDFLSKIRYKNVPRVQNLEEIMKKLDDPKVSFKVLAQLVNQARVHMELITTGQKISTYLNELPGLNRKISSPDMRKFNQETQARINSLLLLEELCANPATQVEGFNAGLSRYALHSATGLHDSEQITMIANQYIDEIKRLHPPLNPKRIHLEGLKNLVTKVSTNLRKSSTSSVQSVAYKGTYEELERERHSLRVLNLRQALDELKKQLHHNYALLQKRGEALTLLLPKTEQLLVESIKFLEAAQSLQDSFLLPILGPLYNKFERLYAQYNSHQEGKQLLVGDSITSFHTEVVQFKDECEKLANKPATAKKESKTTSPVDVSSFA